jgi:hypothetical protein
MKKSCIFTFVLASTFMVSGMQQIHAATQSFDGVISDTMCTKKHMMPGKTDAQCIQECVKGGASYVLVVGSKVYTLAAKPQTIAPFAGKHVHIEGSIKDSSITVTSISDAQTSGMPRNMKM